MSYYKIDVEEVKPSRNVFKDFVVMQKLGRWNMASNRAREEAMANDGEFNYILHHYNELSEEYELNVDSQEVLGIVRIRNKYGF